MIQKCGAKVPHFFYERVMAETAYWKVAHFVVYCKKYAKGAAPWNRENKKIQP